MGGAAWFPSFFCGVAVSPFLLRGAAFLPLGGTTFPPSSVGWYCWIFLLWVVLLFPFLFYVVLHSFPSFG